MGTFVATRERRTNLPVRIDFSRFKRSDDAEPLLPLPRAAEILGVDTERLRKLTLRGLPHGTEDGRPVIGRGTIAAVVEFEKTLPVQQVSAKETATMLGIKYKALLQRLETGNGIFHYTDLDGNQKQVTCYRDLSNHRIFDKTEVDVAAADFKERKKRVTLPEAAKLLGIAVETIDDWADFEKKALTVKLRDGSKVELQLKMWTKTTHCVSRSKIQELAERNRRFGRTHISVWTASERLEVADSVIVHAAADLGIVLTTGKFGRTITTEEFDRIKSYIELKNGGARVLSNAMRRLGLTGLPEPKMVARGAKYFAIIGSVVIGIPELPPIEVEVYPRIRTGRKEFLMKASDIKKLRTSEEGKRLRCIQTLYTGHFERFGNDARVVKRSFFLTFQHGIKLSYLVGLVNAAKNSREAIESLNKASRRREAANLKARVAGGLPW